MKLNRRQHGRSAMELAGEAVHLLRANAASALPAYYIGSLPFVFGALYFWADMSRSPFATQHLPGGSLGLALLFVWMKFWQAVCVNNLRARIALAAPLWTARRVWRLFLVQTAIQPSAALFLPLSLLAAALPLPWVYAFYQNVTALADGETVELRKIFRRAFRQATLWPVQNLLMLVILGIFGLYVFINVATVCAALPHLLKMLLGIESVYTQSALSMLNTTFLAAMFGVTYLCVDPIIKAAYLLRCFYGESLDSGEDLKADLKQFAPTLRAAAAVLMLLAGLACALPARADDSPPPAVSVKTATPSPANAKVAPTAAVPAPELDRAINDVIHQSKYTWRMPRERIIEDNAADEGPIMRFIHRIWQWTKDKIRFFFRGLANIVTKIMTGISNWLQNHLHFRGPGKTGFGWVTSLQALYFALLALVVCALFFFIYRVWLRHYRRAAPVASEALPPAPDLADENTGAEQLPEDGWLKLGRELLGRGELRLALRAFYFASLTQLAGRNLITIAKFKSNRDYERELSRRGHSLPDVRSLFGENVSVFDRSWYGLHEVNAALVGQFLANVERMKGA